MKPCLSILLFAGIIFSASADPGTLHFITAHDGKLYDGTNEFRFISFNIPNLLEIEDNVGFTSKNPWRLPDSFEINDALETVKAMGGAAARTYAITVRRTNDTPEIPRYVLGPGTFDEQSFRVLDEALAAANRTGIRLIIPLVDNWSWMGGRAEYARWRGKTPDDFWSDPLVINDFKQTIRFVLNRTNTVTGIRYADDTSILCWETGNELSSPAPWTAEIAHFIKSLDTNHLVMDGFNTAVLRDESLKIPDVDIVTTHNYPEKGKAFAQLFRANAEKARGIKPYIVGEFGFVPTDQMTKAMDAIIDSGASGGLLWSLRFRDRDGGFYWHSEPYGQNLYKAFHWPASSIGKPYDEEKLLDTVRAKAFAIRGLPVPEPSIPAAPHLLPIADDAAISWQGSAGASAYRVERASSQSGPWQAIAENVDEAFTQYRPQFSDETAPEGKWFYRVLAKNTAGVSEPSNVQFTNVKYATLVDELADFSRVSSRSGHWTISIRDSRSAREDAHRAAGGPGDELIYNLPAEIEGFRIYVFFPEKPGLMKFFLSENGQSFHEITAQSENYFQGDDEYHYWQPALFHAEKIPGGRFLKIQLEAPCQIGRVEIIHAALPK